MSDNYSNNIILEHLKNNFLFNTVHPRLYYSLFKLRIHVNNSRTKEGWTIENLFKDRLGFLNIKLESSVERLLWRLNL